MILISIIAWILMILLRECFHLNELNLVVLVKHLAIKIFQSVVRCLLKYYAYTTTTTANYFLYYINRRFPIDF